MYISGSNRLSLPHPSIYFETRVECSTVWGFLSCKKSTKKLILRIVLVGYRIQGFRLDLLPCGIYRRAMERMRND